MKATGKQKEKMKEYQQRQEVKKKRKAYMKEYHKKRSLNPELKKAESERKRGYYIENKEEIQRRNRGWMEKNKDKFQEYLKKYYSIEDNIERRKENSRRWQKNTNKEKYLEGKRLWENDKRKTDLNFRMKKNLRLRITQAFHKYSKTGKVRKSKDYNIDYDKIIKKLMSKIPTDFNRKSYHIDHIKPCCAFDLTDTKQVEECFSPENHQWLTVEDNLKKVKTDLKQRKNGNTK